MNSLLALVWKNDVSCMLIAAYSSLLLSKFNIIITWPKPPETDEEVIFRLNRYNGL
jgi:hypothetical protein